MIETTAHSLAATLGFLSIHEEIQQEVYDQIKQVLDGRTEPVSRPDALIHQVSHVFRLLRIIPDLTRFLPSSTRLSECSVSAKLTCRDSIAHSIFTAAGHLLIREATKDTVLQIPNPLGQDGFTSLPVPKGGQIVVDMVGVRQCLFFRL